MRAGLRATALAVVAAAICAAPASADSFTPVSLTIGVTPIARLHAPLTVTVHVSADPGALDQRTAPLRVRVKLAGECGGSFRYTNGVVLLDKRLNPQPATGRAYSGGVRGSGRPRAYGSQAVCVFLEEEGDNRMFANDTSLTTNVSRKCTAAASRYDVLRRSRRSRRSRVATARRAARRACGPGVPL